MTYIIFFSIFYTIMSFIIRISGFILFLLSIILLFINNLFLKFLSTSVILIFLFIFICYIYLFFYYKRNKIEIIYFNDDLLLPFIKCDIEIKGKNLPFLFPGIYNEIYFEIYEKDNFIKKEIKIIEFVEKDKFRFVYSFFRHGYFTIKNIKFIWRDIFGLTNFYIKCDYSTVINVMPFFKEEIKLPIYMEKSGDIVIQKIVKENSTDFFENRKYFPGDDPRKINWKILAHTGELQIREVEKIPPKIGEISLVFAPYSSNLYEYEYISSLFLSTVYFLLENRLIVKVLYPSENNFKTVDSFNKNELQHILNNSYKKFSHNLANYVNYLVIFSSYEEFIELVRNYNLKNTFCAISFYEEKYIENIFKNILFIKDNDNIFLDIFNLIKSYNIDKDRKNTLASLVNISERNKIFLEIYRASYEEFS